MVKLMFGVEHYYANEGGSTYEIFPTLSEAKSFCNEKTLWDETHYPLYIFDAEFNLKRIFQEEDLDQRWNYDDHSDTIRKYGELFIEINQRPEMG